MISLTAKNKRFEARIPLSSSKSESNRALIIQALAKEKIELYNLSSARDTQTMIRLLKSEGHVLDVIDAGTTMRFLTAYFCAAGRDQILTGTPRMCQRPIGILVDALRQLGAEINYWKQEGFPPLHIVSKGTKMGGGEISIKGNVSSQFISALLMIGPVLKDGLTLNLEGPVTSRPYAEMTLKLMKHFGVDSSWEGNQIRIDEQAYKANAYTIESDWSSSSYWYSIAALSESAKIHLPGLRKESFQGDSKIAEFMEYFGVSTEFVEDGVILEKTEPKKSDGILDIDFTETPDLAQTISVVSAATGIPLRLRGLHTLRVKETDRIVALQNELGKFGVGLNEVESEVFETQGKFSDSGGLINTYEDHRMAMSFAPLAMVQKEIMLKDPEVVKKSYPEFWDHLGMVGIQKTDWE